MQRINDFMFNLRSEYFQQIEGIYKDIKSLGKLCSLSEIRRKISALYNYSASNEKFTASINYAINKLNTIISFSSQDSLKSKLLNLYNKLVSLLPADLQLELPLNVDQSNPISKVKTKKITWIQKYLWRQLTLSDVLLSPQIPVSVWENGSRRF